MPPHPKQKDQPDPANRREPKVTWNSDSLFSIWKISLYQSQPFRVVSKKIAH